MPSRDRRGGCKIRAPTTKPRKLRNGRGQIGGEPPAKPIKLQNEEVDNTNLNNTDLFFSQIGDGDRIALPVMVKMIVIAVEALENPRGSTQKEIKKRLIEAGLIYPWTELRRGMIAALRSGEIARPKWAIEAGVYGRYILGDGIPMTIGKKKKKTYQRKTRLFKAMGIRGHKSSLKTLRRSRIVRSQTKRSRSRGCPMRSRGKPRRKGNNLRH